MRFPIFLTALLILSALPLLPAASANDPCGTPSRTVNARYVGAGAFTGPCIGVVVGESLFSCFQVHWGVMTQYAGVGGHHGCHVMAYAAPGNLLTDLLA